jgi:tight adherence protein C
MSAAILAALAAVSAAAALGDGAGALAAARERRRVRAQARPDRGDEPGARVAARTRGGGAAAPSLDAVRALLARRGVRAPQDLRGRLAAAGITRRGAVEQVMALKCAAAAGAGLALAPVALGAAGAAPLVVLAAGPAAAFVTPDLVIARRAARRARLLRSEAPELLDRVRLAVEAGVGHERALRLAAAPGDGLLSAELRSALTALELGAPRERALVALCERCPVPEVRGLAAALRRSALHGAPLGGAVAALALASRAERARRVHEDAQRASPKIQLVVALLLVPAALLLVAAALLAGLR